MQKIPAYIKDNLSEPDGNPLTLPDKVAATGENAQAPTIKTDTVRPQNPFLSPGWYFHYLLEQPKQQPPRPLRKLHNF